MSSMWLTLAASPQWHSIRCMPLHLHKAPAHASQDLLPESNLQRASAVVHHIGRLSLKLRIGCDIAGAYWLKWSAGELCHPMQCLKASMS